MQQQGRRPYRPITERKLGMNIFIRSRPQKRLGCRSLECKPIMRRVALAKRLSVGKNSRLIVFKSVYGEDILAAIVREY